MKIIYTLWSTCTTKEMGATNIYEQRREKKNVEEKEEDQTSFIGVTLVLFHLLFVDFFPRLLLSRVSVWLFTL